MFGLALTLSLAAAPPQGGADPPTRTEVNQAVDRGVAHLIDIQQLEGGWNYGSEPRAGATALALYALLKSDVPKKHGAILRGIASLKPSGPLPTYDAAAVLLALTAHDPGLHEARIAELTAQLVADQTGGMWSYPHGSTDLSNTQYAAMGLRAARRSGANVPDLVWKNLEKGVGRFSCNGGGYSYRAGGSNATANMTAAGVACREICREFLGEPERRTRRPAGRKAERDQERDLAFVGRLWRAAIEREGRADGYFLYGIERMGALTGIHDLGGVPWYAAGARYLLDEQHETGGWDHLYNGALGTAFALLFLRRATMVKTGPGVASQSSEKDLGENAPWLIELARDVHSNLAPSRATGHKASSEARSNPASLATDGNRSTWWESGAEDEEPSLRLEFRNRTEANEIVIGHAYAPDIPRGELAVPLLARVEVNGKEAGTVRLWSDPLRRGRLRLEEPAKVKRVEIWFPRVLPSRGGERGIGISEVELHLRE